jgi:serine/threonine-protein kinase RsbW
MTSDMENTVVTEDFTITELHRIRTLVHRAAAVIGLTGAVIENLVAAVNEIAVNAIRYAGGRGRITIRSCPKGVAVDIADNGPGLPADLSGDLPAPNAVGGRGLWMARRLCAYMDISSSPRGVTISLAAIRA